MKMACVVLAVVALTLPVVARAADPVGEVATVFGNVEVTRPGTTQAEKLSAGTRVYAGDKVRTIGDSRVHLLFIDGTFAQLAGGTEVVIGEYVCTKKGGLLKGRLDLALGKLMLKLEKLSAGSTFSVDTGNAIAGVRGTEFTVAYRMDGATPATSVYVFTGEVGVLNKLSAKEVKVASQKWVELSGERIGPPSSMDERMMNSISVDFRAPSALRESLRSSARPAQGPSQPVPGQSAASPEVGLRNQYLSPKGLSVPPSNPAVSVKQGPGPGVPQSPGAAGPQLRQTLDRGSLGPLVR